MHGLGVGVCGVCVAASFILTTRAVRRSLETLDSLPEAHGGGTRAPAPLGLRLGGQEEMTTAARSGEPTCSA